MDMILCEIVTFNPDISRLKENICSIVSQVEKLYIYDNGSKNSSEIEDLLKQLDSNKIYLEKSHRNEGIAKALNNGMNYALANKFKWVLSLDQDSVFPTGGVDEYRKVLKNKTSNLAMCSPTIIDRNLKETLNPKQGNVYVSECITSGALTSVDAWKKVGGYDEWLFIDGVDHEFCWKLIKYKYKILQVQNVVLLHELGFCEKHRIFKHEFIVYNYSAFRKYYQIRNQLVLDAIYQKKSVTFFSILKKMINQSIIVFIYENDKLNKIKSIKRGAFDAYKKIRNYRL